MSWVKILNKEFPGSESSLQHKFTDKGLFYNLSKNTNTLSTVKNRLYKVTISLDLNSSICISV